MAEISIIDIRQGPVGPAGPADVTAANVLTALEAMDAGQQSDSRTAIGAVSGDGTGITNAEAFRGNLDLTPFQRSGGAAAIHAALKANRSCGIAVVGDSTGNTTDEWVYLLGQHIAAQATGHKVVHRVWNGSAWTSTNIQDPATGERAWNHPAAGGLSAYWGNADVAHVGPDLVIEVKINAASYAALNGKGLIQMWGSVPDRGWRILIGSGTFQLNWYEADGTTLRAPGSSSAIPWVDGTAIWLRVFLDVDNGSSQYTVTHYYSTDGVTWTTAGTLTGATGVTTVNDSPTILEIMSSAFTNGSVRAVRIRSSLTGPTENNLALDNAWRGSNTNDELTLTGDPVLQIDNMSVSGWKIADVTQAQLNNIDNHGTLLAFISLAHNEGYSPGMNGMDWTDAIKAIAVMLQARCPLAQIVLVSQNPKTVFGTVDQYDVDGHGLRVAQLMSLAAREGYGLVNFFRAIYDDGSPIIDLTPDGFHPNAAGSLVMAAAATEGYDQARF
jgi:lysophospholipase L1-like esterase